MSFFKVITEYDNKVILRNPELRPCCNKLSYEFYAETSLNSGSTCIMLIWRCAYCRTTEPVSLGSGHSFILITTIKRC